MRAIALWSGCEPARRGKRPAETGVALAAQQPLRHRLRASQPRPRRRRLAATCRISHCEARQQMANSQLCCNNRFVFRKTGRPPSPQSSVFRRSLALLLVVALLFGQAGNYVHALSHLHAQLQSSACVAADDAGQCEPDQDVCLQCLAFAALAVAMPALASWLLIACSRRWHYPLPAERHLAPVFSPRPRSRGPPLTGLSFT